MKETKRRIVREVTSKLNKLPTDKQNYILGIMDGIMISSRNTRIDDSGEKEKAEAGKE